VVRGRPRLRFEHEPHGCFFWTRTSRITRIFFSLQITRINTDFFVYELTRITRTILVYELARITRFFFEHEFSIFSTELWLHLIILWLSANGTNLKTRLFETLGLTWFTDPQTALRLSGVIEIKCHAQGFFAHSTGVCTRLRGFFVENTVTPYSFTVAKSPIARNLTNLLKSNRKKLNDLKGFARFLSQSDTHYHQHRTCYRLHPSPFQCDGRQGVLRILRTCNFYWRSCEASV